MFPLLAFLFVLRPTRLHLLGRPRGGHLVHLFGFTVCSTILDVALFFLLKSEVTGSAALANPFFIQLKPQPYVHPPVLPFFRYLSQ